MKPRRVAILGSTGSIGRQALAVISARPELTACALAAGSNWRLLAEQARQFCPEAVALADDRAASDLHRELPAGTGMLTGGDAMTELVASTRPDVLLSGVVGSAGLKPTLAGIECGSTLAIANKETLVMAGAIVMPAARRAGVSVLPVDSEHSAIFQCLAAGRRREVRRVVITASGGALRDMDGDRAEQASIRDVLNHPTWNMGRKVTVDSATMINKALEVVEAHWLFDLPGDRIEVLVHPESVVHSFVEFCDGSVIAQMGRPDMTMPIAYALCWPDRPERSAAPLDLAALGRLTFLPLRPRQRRAVNLGFRAVDRGPAAAAALNSANEAAVQAFLDGRISFGRIVPLVENIMNQAPFPDETTLARLMEVDAWARRRVAEQLTTTEGQAKQPAARGSDPQEN